MNRLKSLEDYEPTLIKENSGFGDRRECFVRDTGQHHFALMTPGFCLLWGVAGFRVEDVRIYPLFYHGRSELNFS
jgi:hypothetical protein